MSYMELFNNIKFKKLDDYTKYKKEKVKTDEDDNFIEYDVLFIYRELICGNEGYFKNKITGENCGNHIKLYKHFYDKAGNFIKEGIDDENIYELCYYADEK